MIILTLRIDELESGIMQIENDIDLSTEHSELEVKVALGFVGIVQNALKKQRGEKIEKDPFWNA